MASVIHRVEFKAYMSHMSYANRTHDRERTWRLINLDLEATESGDRGEEWWIFCYDNMEAITACEPMAGGDVYVGYLARLFRIWSATNHGNKE